MQKIQLLAKRYAQALFGLALDNKSVEQVASDMSLVQSVLTQNRDLRKVLHNPVLDASVKLRLVRAIFGQKKLISELSLRFIQLIVRKKRESNLLGICQAFEDLYFEFKNLVRAEVITATLLDEANKKELTDKINSITHKEVRLKETVDENLVGGFVLRVDDYQLDASISRKLRNLKKTFAENLYVKQF